MSRKKRNGFTIVELVIVIAVIAILAAVLIPTFSSLINRANEAADTAMVKNLNTLLVSDEALNGTPETMSDVLETVKEGGYTLEKLTPTSNGDILWDEENNQFVLKNGDDVVYSAKDVTKSAWKLWQIIDEKPTEEKGYSYYLSDNFAATEIEVSAGVDTGTCSVDVVFTTEESKEITICTNGGTLTVNAPLSTVEHRGTADSVNITAIAGESYHEYGEIDDELTISAGRAVIESGAKVNAITANGIVEQDNNSITLELADGSLIIGEIKINNSDLKIGHNTSLKLPVVAGGNSKIQNHNDDVTIFADASVHFDGENKGIQKVVVTTAAELIEEFSKEKSYIQLGADITLSSSDFNSDNNCYLFQASSFAETYLDLNGHYIKDPNYDSFAYTDENNKGQQLIGTYGSITIDDTSVDLSGAIYATRNLIRTEGNNDAETTSHIKHGKFVTKSYTGGTCLFLSTTNVIIDDCNVYATNFGVYIGSNGNTVNCSVSGGTVVGTANNNTQVANNYAYAFACICDNAVFNDITVYGIQGALSINGGGATVNGGYYEASGKAYDLYEEATGFDALAEYCKTDTVTDSMIFYGGYFAGENSTTDIKVNGGKFVSTSRNAVQVGNSNDGGAGEVAKVVINNGAFIGKNKAVVVSEASDYGLGVLALYGGTFSHDVTDVMNDRTNYQCIQSGDEYIVTEK